jgi:glycosyltransferase involved in cell wall biosynthesis
MVKVVNKLGQCYCLRDLPEPPPGRTGWPWTVASPPVAEAMPDGSPWPRVSIVTPSYNQGQFIEETIRSVLLQGYPDLEYLIMDGGSTDNSVDIIRRYEPWLAYWVSEPDRGQSHAVNKGWQRATGDILAFLNSDDLYLSGAIFRAVEALSQKPECAMVYGDGLWVDETGRFLKLQESGPLDARQLLTGTCSYGIPQPTAFMRREAVEAVSGLDESLHMAMDFDLWVKLALRYPLIYVSGPPWAALRFHANMKTTVRAMEGLVADLVVLERGLRDPNCPLGLSIKGNRAYVRVCLDLAIMHLQESKVRLSKEYFIRALRSSLAETMRQSFSRLLIHSYRAIIPGRLQQWVRHLRGIEEQGYSHVRY